MQQFRKGSFEGTRCSLSLHASTLADWRKRRCRPKTIERMSTFIRRGTVADAEALAAIYDPIVANTYISFEYIPPGPDEMRRRIASARDDYPWLVFANAGHVRGYAYASPHRSRPAYQWAVDVSVYVAPGGAAPRHRAPALHGTIPNSRRSGILCGIRRRRVAKRA